MSATAFASPLSLILADWWDPRTWLSSVGNFFHGAFDAGTAVVNLSGAVLTILEQFFRFFFDTGHLIADAVKWAKVILPGISDPETNDVLSRIIGRGEFTEIAVNRGSDGRVGRTFSVRHDSMATPDALRQLRAGSAIVVHRGRPPALVQLRPWYSDRRFRHFAERRFLRNADYANRPS